MPEHIPYRDGEPAPGPEYIRARLVDEQGQAEEVWINPNDLQHGPITQSDVNAFLPVLRWQWRHIQRYATWCRTFEDWELGFMRDHHPENEVAIFSRATY